MDAPRRRRLRLAGYDYSLPGAYFVTICSRNRKCLFGEVVDGEMRRNRLGNLVAACWNKIPALCSTAALDAFVVMPDHLHGIILLSEPAAVGAGHCPARTGHRPARTGHCPARTGHRPALPRPLPVIIGSFKSAVTRQAGYPVWQRGYWERIIRNEKELNECRRYIDNNPRGWKNP